MRRGEKEILDKSIIESILTKSEICRIGIQDIDSPYIVPLNYGYDSGKIYFHSASQGRKIELLRKNNKVSFEIEFSSEIIKGSNPCSWTAKYRSLMGTGTIDIISDADGIRRGLDLIMNHYGSNEGTYEEGYLGRIVILQLNIDTITGKQSGEWGLL